jgi:predicted HTH transcriptional regulator
MRVFRDVGLVEQLGSGMGRILNAYDRSVFKFAGDFLIVTFPFADGFDAVINANNGVNNVKNGVNNVILSAFRDNPSITIKGLAKLTGISARTIDREIESLKAKGKLKRVGSTRSGYWEICK